MTTIDTATAFARQHSRVFGGRAEAHPSSISDAAIVQGAHWPEAMVLTGDLYAGAVLLSCYATGCAAKDPDLDTEVVIALRRVGVEMRPATSAESDVIA
jgi:hypothetical protein